VKLRTKVTKGAGSTAAALAMAYKLLDSAQARWRAINGAELVREVLDGARFKTESRSPTTPTHRHADTPTRRHADTPTHRHTRGSPPEKSHASIHNI